MPRMCCNMLVNLCNALTSNSKPRTWSLEATLLMAIIEFDTVTGSSLSATLMNVWMDLRVIDALARSGLAL